jgi:hypothetical protein
VRRLLLWSLLIASASAALVGLGVVGVSSWESRAADICREEAPRTAGDVSPSWDWGELAYVCDYRVPSEQPKRVGILDAFHGEDSRRHRR